MKSVVATTLFLCAFAPAAMAQQGTVVYQETVKLELDLPPEMRNADIPRETSARRQLLFDGGASLMKTLPEERKEEADVDSEPGPVRIRIMGARPNEEVYTNFEEGTRIEKRDFLGREFLVSGEVPEISWRLTGEESRFLGYASRKAVATRDSVEIEAWFTPEIPIPAGPGMYGGLPGLILVVTEDEGRRSFVATEVKLGEIADAPAPPTGGKEVTRAEFEEIVEEKMKEMGAERGRGGAFRIRIQD